MSALLDAALAYAAQGIPVFPCVPRTKVPACANGFHDATTDPAQITTWWTETPNANIAFTPHAIGCGVVDLDGQEGMGAWETWCQDQSGGPSPSTWTVRTPRGGLHLYFKGELPTSVKRLIPGQPVDTRGRGSYALLPPSLTPDGIYFLENRAAVAPLPYFVAERVLEMATKLAVDGNPDVALDQPQNVQIMTRFIWDHGPCREGFRNQSAFNLATQCRDHGLSEDMTLVLLRRWDAGNSPPLGDELPLPVWSAYHGNAQNKGPGSKAVDPASRMLEAYKPEPLPGPLPFDAILGRDVAPVQEIIPGLIERGIVTFLAGAGGSHKSRTALHWGLAIATGTPVYGRPVEQADFLYLSYEDHPDEVARRTQAICRRMGITDAPRASFWDLTDNGQPLAIVDEVGCREQPFASQIREWLKSREGHKFVVLDSAYNVLQFVGAAKVDEALVKAGIEFLGRLGRECDATFLVLWHPSQAGQERGDASGWSVAWHNTPRARLSISADKHEEGTYLLKVEKRNNAARGEPLSLRWDQGMLSPQRPEVRQESDTSLLEATLEVITECERTGHYLKQSGRVMAWCKDILRRAAPSRRITDDLLRELAASLAREGKVRYVTGRGHELAGYRRVDLA